VHRLDVQNEASFLKKIVSIIFETKKFSASRFVQVQQCKIVSWTVVFGGCETYKRARAKEWIIYAKSTL